MEDGFVHEPLGDYSSKFWDGFFDGVDVSTRDAVVDGVILFFGI